MMLPRIDRLRRLAGALLVAGLLAGCDGGPPGPGLDDPQAATLAPFFAQLLALEQGRRQQPLTIVQLGDSHTASDRFTGRLRARFQQRFGAAGRGMLPPGVPFDYYRPTLVTAQQTGDWQVFSTFRNAGEALFGLTGFTLRGASPDASIALQSQEPAGFDHVAVDFVRQPGGGTLLATVDNAAPQRVPTAGAAVQAARLDLKVPEGSRRLVIQPAGDGPIDLLAWTVERRGPGIEFDNQGIVGATAAVLNAAEPNTTEWELKARDPALVILAFGTNEGFDDNLSANAYGTMFAARLAALHRAVPQAALLVIGPPDGNRLPRGCRDVLPDPVHASCAPLSEAEQQRYQTLVADAPANNFCRWLPPPNLAVVRGLQQSAAARNNAYFWDWSRIMGGACGMTDWVQRTPPLGADDHIHLRQEGYEASADALFDRLMALYERYKAAQGGGATS